MSGSIEKILRCLVPLKLVILTENPGREHRAICAATHRAFQGGHYSSEANEAYFAAGEDLGVTIVEADFSQGAESVGALLRRTRDSALHTLVVAVLHDRPGADFQQCLEELDHAAHEEGGDRPAVGLLPIFLREGAWQGETQGLNYLTLDEYALRTTYVAAHVLAFAWRMLGPEDQRLSLFLSHAKLDGLPLARSFQHQLGSLHGLEHFYDARHIPPGSNWKRILRRGVERSAVVALRTNVYEERFWCVQELDWAEDYGCPLVVVEARTHLVCAREFLPVGGSPRVHVPDGNLPRILQATLREAMRVRLFVRQTEALCDAGVLAPESVLRVPRTSLATLGLRCAWQEKSERHVTHVFIPERFREAHRPVAERLVQGYFADAWLGTPQIFVQDLLARDEP